MLVIPVDLFVSFFLAIFVYYTLLFLLSRRDPRHQISRSKKWGFVILVPAHNEELVIHDTISRAALIPGVHVVPINDGSTDKTEIIVASLASSYVHPLNRRYPDAKKGKGQALNYAYGYIQDHYASWFPGLPHDRIIVTVLDADGYLDAELFGYVAGMLERNPRLGGIQTPVTIQHPRTSLWLRMQDLEFVGFSCFVQQARHWFSSIGLGGNGQFIRASSLEKLGATPWNDALSEDLDIGIRLLLQDVRLGYCNKGFVHQQGLTKLRPLLKQRTRWIQGHYQAWRYLPKIWRSPLPLHTKIDLTLYLTLVVSVLLILLNDLISLGVLIGLVMSTSWIMDAFFSISPYFGRSMLLLLSVGPALLFAFTYNKYSRSKIPPTSWPAIVAVFCVYGWIWLYASVVAIARIARKRNNWVKTERVQAKIADNL